jgi:hypothetical protein
LEKHPIFGKTSQELLVDCTDVGRVSVWKEGKKNPT